MAHAGEEQGDLVAGIGRDDAGGEDAGAFPLHIVGQGRRALRTGQLQHLHGGVVVVEHGSLGGLIHQLLVRGGERFGRPLHQIPLGRGRQGDFESVLQLLDAVERCANAIFEQTTMLVAVASYFSSPTPSGAGAV